MTLRKLLITLQKLLFLLFVGWLVVALVPEKDLHLNFTDVEKALTARGGDKQNSESFREMLKKNFPDYPERVDYENKQAEFYRSGLNKILESKANRGGMSYPIKITSQDKDKLTSEEKEAFDYFKGKNFYSYYQNLKTPPNIYDTRKSFLLKMENKEVRNKILEDSKKRLEYFKMAFE